MELRMYDYCALVEGLRNARTYVTDETGAVQENIIWNTEHVTKTFLTFLK